MWLLVAAGVIVLYYVFSWLLFRLKYDLHKLPSPPKLPLVGHLHHILKMGDRLNQNKWLLDWHEKLGRPKIMLKTVPGDTAIVIFDCDYVKNKVLGRDGFPRSKLYTGLQEIFVGPHGHKVSLSAPDPTPFSQAIRRAIAQSFAPNHIRQCFEKLYGVIEHAAERIEREAKEGPVDFEEIFPHMTTDIVGRVGFDMDFGGISKTGQVYHCFVAAFGHFMDAWFKPHLQLYMWLFPRSKPALRKKMDQENIFKVHEHVVNTIMSRPYPPETEQSLWANLRRMIDPDTGKPVDRKKLVGEVITMVGAAMDTTGHMLGWIFAMLSDRDDVVDRILEDMKVLGLYGPGARDPEFADLSKLPYLTAVIKECMRVLDSLAALTSRCLPRDMEVFGYRLPKGLQVYVPGNVYSHLEEYFDEPEVFKPERWLSGKNYDFYIPFSYGPRDCVGQRLGMQEMQLTLLLLLPRFKMKLTNGETFNYIMEHKYYESVMCSAKGGLNFDITPRT